MRGQQQASPDDDWGEGNLIPSFGLPAAATGALPDGWEAVCPNPALAPGFAWGQAPDGKPALIARGNGRQECFGSLRCRVPLQGQKTYRLRVRLHAEGLHDLNRHLVHGLYGENLASGIMSYRREGDWIVGDQRLPGPAESGDGEVRLYFRFSPHGQVWWERVSLQECEPIAPRLVKVACSWGSGDLEYWGRWLDHAGQRRVDVALLPEVFDGRTVGGTPLDGPTGSLLAEKARQWGMYVAGTFNEQRGDLVLNSAPLYDRQGQLVGVYSKNMVYDPELDAGTTPGVGYPVFQADFGKVGIIICYDSWFPETVRLLAYRGAELVLFPNAGYYTGLMSARAADNGVWIAVSSVVCPAGVWDSGGNRGGEMHPDPTQHAPSSIRSFEKDDDLKLVTATLDLSTCYSPAWGGNLVSAPGSRRVRQTLIFPIEEEIAREARRWWSD